MADISLPLRRGRPETQVEPSASLLVNRSPIVRPRPRGWAVLALAVLCLCAFVASLLIGSVAIPLPDALHILYGGEATRASWETILMQFRLPKALTALLSGAALATSGLLMQTLFRNPLADPYILGVSSGASLGAAVIILAGGIGGAGGALLRQFGLVGDAALIVAASLGAAAAMGLVLLVARRVQNIAALLILGLMSGYLTGSLVQILTQFASREQVQAYSQWGFGSFVGVTWGQMPVFALAISLGLALTLPALKPLNALLLGETYARSMGVNVGRVRVLVIASAALLAGAVTAFCGPIAFLGVAVPHVVRGVVRTHDHRLLLAACLFLGGTLALVADMISQALGGNVVLPLNAITALFGAPMVVLVLLRRSRSST